MNRVYQCLVCSVVVLAGCAGNANAPSMFLLDSSYPTANKAAVSMPVLVVDQVRVAPFLDTSGIVYQTEAHRVVVADNNRWASPLSAQLTDGLYSALGAALDDAAVQRDNRHAPAQALHLATRVDEFMGHYDGYAHIAGQWQLMDGDGTRLAGDRFEQRIPLDSDGYDALVASLSRGWRMTARNLAPALANALSKR